MCRHVVMTLLIVLAPALQAAGQTTAPAPSPTTTTATVSSDPLVEQAAVAAERGELAPFAAEMDEAAMLMLDIAGMSDGDEVIRHATLRRFGRYFARVQTMDDDRRVTLAWLARRPGVLRALMLIVSDDDPPDRVLDVLTALRTGSPGGVERFPALAAAVCVVWDDPARVGESEEGDAAASDPARFARVVRLFRSYTDSARSLAIAPDALPSDLLVFVVDVDALEQEIAWARASYGRRVNVAGAFFDVPPAPPTLDRTAPPDAPAAYVLPNIRRAGGSSGDQARYASVVGKAWGVPSVVCQGVEGLGERQAWVTFLEPAGRRSRWLTHAARRAVQGDVLGVATDPQTGETITEADLQLLGLLLSTAPRDRDASTALCELIDVAPAGMRIEMLERAIALAPGRRRAWLALADAVARDALPAGDRRRAEALVARHLLGRSPVLAAEVLRRMAGPGNEAGQLDAIETAITAARARGPVLAHLRLAQFDLLRELNRTEEATELLAGLLSEPEPIGSYVLPALSRMDEILREQNDVAALAGLYQHAWSRLPAPRPSPQAGATPHVLVGHAYAALLDELGERVEAQNVRGRLGALVITGVRR